MSSLFFPLPLTLDSRCSSRVKRWQTQLVAKFLLDELSLCRVMIVAKGMGMLCDADVGGCDGLSECNRTVCVCCGGGCVLCGGDGICVGGFVFDNGCAHNNNCVCDDFVCV